MLAETKHTGGMFDRRSQTSGEMLRLPENWLLCFTLTPGDRTAALVASLKKLKPPGNKWLQQSPEETETMAATTEHAPGECFALMRRPLPLLRKPTGIGTKRWQS